MKIIAILAMTGVIGAAEVQTLRGAMPTQLAELEVLSNQLAQAQSTVSYSDITKYHAAIKAYIAKIQIWI
jgi:hypothetical protein